MNRQAEYTRLTTAVETQAAARDVEGLRASRETLSRLCFEAQIELDRLTSDLQKARDDRQSLDDALRNAEGERREQRPTPSECRLPVIRLAVGDAFQAMADLESNLLRADVTPDALARHLRQIEELVRQTAELVAGLPAKLDVPLEDATFREELDQTLRLEERVRAIVISKPSGGQS